MKGPSLLHAGLTLYLFQSQYADQKPAVKKSASESREALQRTLKSFERSAVLPADEPAFNP